MEDQYAFDTISATTFDALLKKYPDVVPEKLSELESQRLRIIPAAVHRREPKYLTKDELATLMDWKLSHGTFRPGLPKLISQNDASSVQELTQAHLSHLDLRDPDAVARALKGLCTLRGVGPATASLILSTAFQDEVPFFSDDLYTWALWNERPSRKGAERGDDKVGFGECKLKYSEKEYKALLARVKEFEDRTMGDDGKGVSALELEKVAYVLSKQGLGGEDVAVGEGGKGKKRKADDEGKKGEEREEKKKKQTKKEQTKQTKTKTRTRT